MSLWTFGTLRRQKNAEKSEDVHHASTTALGSLIGSEVTNVAMISPHQGTGNDAENPSSSLRLSIDERMRGRDDGDTVADERGRAK